MGIMGVLAIIGRLLALPLMLLGRLILFFWQFLWLSPFLLLGLWLYHRSRSGQGGQTPPQREENAPSGEQMPHFRGVVKTVDYREVPEDGEEEK